VAWDEESKPTEVETTDHATHYACCHRLQLRYANTFRVVTGVEWRGAFTFRARVVGEHLAAVLDAGFQVLCCYDRRTSFIPVGVGRFYLARTPASFGEEACVTVTGEVLELHPRRLTCNLVYRVGEEVFATMEDVSMVQVARQEPRMQPAQVESDALAIPGGRDMVECSKASLMLLASDERLAVVTNVIRQAAKDITGGNVDNNKSLVDNGVVSLGVVELVAKLSVALKMHVSVMVVFNAESLTLLAEDVLGRLMIDPETTGGDLAARAATFPNVNREGLQALIDTTITFMFHQSFFAKLCERPRYVLNTLHYGMRRCALNPGPIAYFQGLIAMDVTKRMSLSTVTTKLNLDFTSEKYGVVNFKNIDANLHFTVKDIVRVSEQGLYSLIGGSGLDGLECHFGRIFWASECKAHFHKEIMYGDKFILKSHIEGILGPRIHFQIRFFDVDAHGAAKDLCFVVDWKMLMPVYPYGKEDAFYNFEADQSTFDSLIAKFEVTRAEERTAYLKRHRILFSVCAPLLVLLFIALLYAMMYGTLLL
jgi:acyl-CoA thioesterase FadM